VANAGDCRAVLSRRGRALDLSTDHKPTSAAEALRIAAAGGTVDSEGYVNGCVSVSRALGDWCAPLKAHHSGDPLSGEPEVVEHVLTGEDEFLLIGCDGLWDVLSSQQAVEFARQRLRQHNDPRLMAVELAREAIARHSSDNVTVLCVCLSPEPPPARLPPLRRGNSRLFLRCISTEALADVQRLMDGGTRATKCAEEDEEPAMEAWSAPSGQTGDGRTALNAKLGF
jgi:protein phosphatase 2C family protein 2/3